MANYYIPRCKTLRISARLSMNKLAGEAQVDRGTIKKIESNHGVIELTADKVFSALKQHHSDIEKDKEVVVK
jgi:transcriptional regulator with XRE-family HTH domain